MTRLLLVIAAIVLLGLMVRKALTAAINEAKPGPKPRKSPNLPPDRLVCGVCGESFDPDKTGWICPKCGK